MSLGEFDLIRRYFNRPQSSQSETRLGIGDDAALIAWTAGKELAITVDTLVAGVHFLPDTDPENLGHKVLAVNLSDLAAMGAQPKWVTLALTLPQADAAWLEAFSRGFFRLAARYGVELIGGDTTRGPLAITVQAIGDVPGSAALRRSGAAVGDLIYMSGELGRAGLGLKMLLGQTAQVDPIALARQEKPEPRVALGLALRGLAHASIDITDGLAADLGHILESSGVGAELIYEQLPLSDSVKAYINETGDWLMPLQAGDDYELCFTLPPQLEAGFRERLTESEVSCVCIGRITASETSQLTIIREGMALDLSPKGYDHFGTVLTDRP